MTEHGHHQHGPASVPCILTLVALNAQLLRRTCL